MSPPKGNRDERNKTPSTRPSRSVAAKSKSIIRNRAEKPTKIIESDGIRTRSQRAIANCPIFILNDDCVREVFSYLSVVDLCAVKDTCRRFNVMADATVQTRFQKESEFKYIVDGTNVKDFVSTMQHFGKFIDGRLIIETETSFNAKDMWLQLKHCTALKVLDLLGVNVRGFPSPSYRLKKVLRNLERLKFEKCAGGDLDFARIINVCENLQYLNVYCTPDGASDALITHIARESSQIEDLFFGSLLSNSDTFADNVAKLRNLKKLRMLCLYCNNYRIASAIEVLAANNPLNQLHLINVFVDEDLCRALDRFSSLRYSTALPADASEVTDAVRQAFVTFSWDAAVEQFYKLKLYGD